MFVSVCRLLLCTRSVMIVCASIGGTKQIACAFQGIASSWFVMCTFSLCLSGFFSPLLCYAGPALSRSAFTLYNLLVGDCIQTCGYNHLFCFAISK